jgi:signal transduction histidine kinase
MFKKISGISFIILFPTIITFGQITTEKIDSINSISFEEIVSNLKLYLNIFSDNLKNAKKINYKKGEGMALSKLALTQYMLGQYDKSTEFHIKSFGVFSENNMMFELADSYGEFGYQLKRRDLKKANFYMLKALGICEKLENNQGLLSKLFDNYAVIKEYENKLDSAKYFTKKALAIKYKLNDSVGIPFSLNKLAGLYAKEKNFRKAFEYLDISDFYRKKQNHLFGLVENLTLRADFFRYQNKIDSSLYYYKITLRIADSLNYNYLSSYSLENISQLYLQINNYQNAYHYYKKFIQYRDSLDNLEKNSRILQLEIAYEAEQKDKIIAENNLEIQQRNSWLLMALIIILIISVFSFLLYKFQKQKRERAIREIELQNEIKNNKLEKNLIDEKLRISRELHDNIGSQLTFIISSIDNLTYQNKTNQISRPLNNLKEFSRTALFDLRNTIWALKEENGNFEKLYYKVNDLIQRLNNADMGINISLLMEMTNYWPLTSFQMLNLFRIIQEAIQNSVKHSSAKNIYVVFKNIDEKPTIIIKDDGKGFDISKNFETSGLENMKLRSQQSNHKFIINSDKNGTEIQVSLSI